jgi:cyclic beta-1,2-glucan synthetase
MYRLMTESLLGLQLMGDKLKISPCLPRDWTTYQLHYRYRDTMYHIRVNQNGDTANSVSVTVDGVNQVDGLIALIDDRQHHMVEIIVHL